MLPSNKTNNMGLNQLADEQMSRLYEHFVLAYYSRHFPKSGARAAKIEWALDNDYDDMLPEMKTDITLKKENGDIVIIDTKYYSQTMQANPLYNTRTIHSGNLYQIFTYVKNKANNYLGNVEGILLYAKTDEPISPDCNYMMSGNRIRVKTLDLDGDFMTIRQQLDELFVNS
jgi:5-methylcytosine-specific restriction enzyme subunit McrC